VTNKDDWIRVKEYIQMKNYSKIFYVYKLVYYIESGICFFVSHTYALYFAGLWGLVNNAGWATFGEVEWVSMQTYRQHNKTKL
jgi:hypothetical protein